jgi:hypothetical protein
MAQASIKVGGVAQIHFHVKIHGSDKLSMDRGVCWQATRASAQSAVIASAR